MAKSIPANMLSADPITTDSSQPDLPWGIVPSPFSVPSSDADLSYTVYLVYDSVYLYIGIEANDDQLVKDSEFPWQDDDFEVFVDSDQVDNDLFESPSDVTDSKEGFQNYH